MCVSGVLVGNAEGICVGDWEGRGLLPVGEAVWPFLSFFFLSVDFGTTPGITVKACVEKASSGVSGSIQSAAQNGESINVSVDANSKATAESFVRESIVVRFGFVMYRFEIRITGIVTM